MNENSHRLLIDIHSFGERGLGVRARQPIASGQVIEESPVFIIDHDEFCHMEKMKLCDYVFYWPDGHDVVVFGYLSMANHSETPNAELIRNVDNRVITWRAVRDIAQGEEITFKYQKTWFPVIK